MTTKRRALGRGLAALIPAAAGAPAPSGRSGPDSVNGDTTASGAGAPPSPHSSVVMGSSSPSSISSLPSPIAGLSPAGTRRPGVEPREGLRVVGIEEVHPTRDQPRKTFDDARLEDLATSIRSQGLIQPLVVRLREAGGYEIIAGERRWRAAQRAGLHTVHVVVREIAPARAFEMAMVENLQREDLNPIEEAEGFDRLLREHGYSHESLATRVGKDRTTITNALRLLKLPPGVRGLVIAGRLSMGHARAILGLESLVDTRKPTAGSAAPNVSAAHVLERMEGLGRKVAARDLSVRQVEALVKSQKAAAAPGPADTGASTGASGPATSPSTASGRDLATRLSRALGLRVRVVEAGPNRGHVELHYGSLDQLDGLLIKLLP